MAAQLDGGPIFCACSMPLSPMRLLRIPEPFGHPDWRFEPLIAGFRPLAHVTGHRCTLLSRNESTHSEAGCCSRKKSRTRFVLTTRFWMERLPVGSQTAAATSATCCSVASGRDFMRCDVLDIDGPTDGRSTSWQIKNQDYSKMEGGHELCARLEWGARLTKAVKPTLRLV